MVLATALAFGAGPARSGVVAGAGTGFGEAADAGLGREPSATINPSPDRWESAPSWLRD